MPVAQGHKSYIQLGKETTFGVAATVITKFEMVSWSVAPVIGSIPDPSLFSAQSRRGFFEGGKSYKGTFVVRLNYDGLLELFRAVSGGAGYSSAVVSGGTNTRDHTFKESASLNSYTIEAIVGDIPTGKCFQLLGAKFISVTVRGTAGQGADAMLMAEFTVVARDMISNVTITGSLTFPTVFPMLFHQASCIDDGANLMAVVRGVVSGGTTFTRVGGSNTTDGIVANMEVSGVGVAAGTIVSSVSSATVLILSASATGATQLTFNRTDTQGYLRMRSFEVTLENPHDEARFYLGSLVPDEAIRNDFISAKWKFTSEFTNVAAYDLARTWAATGSEPSPRLIFQHPTAIESTFYREFELRSNKAQYTEYSPPVEGYGIVIASYTLDAFHDTVDVSGMLMRIRNITGALGA